uniref:Uncharacterized protein n=1 Tax=Pyrodinium bahamense TaxID=73915 RepID=A0A7S0FNJ1_9DINO
MAVHGGGITSSTLVDGSPGSSAGQRHAAGSGASNGASHAAQCPARQGAAAVAPAPTKQITAATGQAKPPPGDASSASASSTGLSTTGKGHGTASAGFGGSRGGAPSWSAAAPSFWPFGGGGRREWPRTVKEAEAYYCDQRLQELRQGPRKRAAPAPAAAEDLNDFSSTQSVTYSSEPSPMTLPSMTGNQALDEFAHVMPPQQAPPAAGGRGNLGTSPNGRHEAAATESTSSSSPQQRTGFSFSRLIGIELPGRATLRRSPTS